MTGTCVLTGFLYRDEMIHTVATGQVVIFPSWLGGTVRAEFISKNEALNFVDAKRALEKVEYAEQALQVSGAGCQVSGIECQVSGGVA